MRLTLPIVGTLSGSVNLRADFMVKPEALDDKIWILFALLMLAFSI